MAVAVPIIPAPLSMRSRALLRVPLLLALTVIICGLIKSNGWVNSLFYLFVTSHAVDKLVLCLETGVTSIMSNDHSPNLIEWGISIFFYPLRKNDVHEWDPFLIICLMHASQVWMMNFLGLFGKDREYKLIPTTFFGILHLMHFMYSLIRKENGYPALFVMARIPEIFVIALIALVHSLHKVSILLHNGNVRSLPLRYRDWPLSDDFPTVLFNIGITCLRTTRSLGLLNDLGPIKIPLAAGISPEYTSVIKKRFENQNGFLNKEEIVDEPQKPSLFTGRLVPWILSLGFAYTFLQLLQLGAYRIFSWCFGRKEVLVEDNDLKQEVESDVDSDFDPTVEVLSDLEESTSENDDDHLAWEDENAELCEEIVDLTRDLSENGNRTSSATTANSVGQILNLLNQPTQLLTRSQYKALELENSDISDSRSLTHNSSPSLFGRLLSVDSFSFSSRHCVICQSEVRCIVLRPCGCLCLCDDCRIALAARKFKDCPCCRRIVSGFSRIYEP